jgi:hypothetical protein
MAPQDAATQEPIDSEVNELVDDRLDDVAGGTYRNGLLLGKPQFD